MELYQLVRLRNDLSKALDVSILQQEIESNYSRLQNLVEGIDQDIASMLKDISNDHLNLISFFERDVENLKNVIAVIQGKIDKLAENFFLENYQLELKYINPDLIRNLRTITRNEEFENVMIQRINLYSSWRYPALELGCRDGEYTKFLIASDPLYIADYFEEFLNSAVAQFSELYQSRVKKYIIKDFYKINNLPNNQFGLIFSFNFFNYLSLDSIKQFLIQSMNWLRPGGIIIFTYNNADLPAAAGYAENYFMTYVPKSILVPMAESLGFEKIFSYDNDPAFSIIEFKKPGILNSIKAGQTLGEIKFFNN